MADAWRRPADPVLWGILALASLATAVVATVPELRFSYTAPTLKVALGTAATLIATLVGYLVVGRSRLSADIDLALVAYGMLVLAAADALILILPHLFVAGYIGPAFATWLPLAAQLVAAAALALAALLPSKVAPRATFWWGAASGLSAVALFGVVGAAIPLPADNSAQFSSPSTPHPHLDFARSIAVAELLVAALFAIACVGFAARAHRREERLAWWLSVGAGLAAIAQVNFALFLSEFSRWLYTGDVIRLFAYAAWLLGAMAEISLYWKQQATLAVEAERRRIARDLHDGLAQELAFIFAETRALPRNGRSQLIASSAERALSESRRAIAALSSDVSEELDDVLRRTLEIIADQYGCELMLDVSEERPVPSVIVEELARIAREATINACRHGHAGSVEVVARSTEHEGWLAVRDDGRGFDTHAEVGDGSFGLQSICERAEAIGGIASIRSTPGHGTEVEVRW
jgi:signal transduction histidine kinase